MFPKVYSALVAVGILVVLAAIVFIGLDYAGKGDTAGLDPRDLGLAIFGLVLAIVGGWLGSRNQAATGADPAPAK